MNGITQGARARSTPPHLLGLGRQRVIVERVEPVVDGGRFPIKRTVGEWVEVTALLFADGHDRLGAAVRWRHAGPGTIADARTAHAIADDGWREAPLRPLGDDLWRGAFQVTQLGTYEYAVEGWIDRFASWHHALLAKADAGLDVSSELLEGAALVQAGAERAAAPGAASATAGDDALQLLEFADYFRSHRSNRSRVWAARDPELAVLMARHPDRGLASGSDPLLRVTVDVERARYGAWYEMFPRSCTPDPSRSGTFREAEARLPEIAALGFQVLYLPPIHPIGLTHRKGRNNALVAQPGDPGSPWAIGATDGGHTAIEPGLGTLADFDRFVAVANRVGLEVALDIAFQTSPDHPWVRQHPEWFRHRPDGTIKYAENPPKQYQDIYPLDFESSDWMGLWDALRDVFLFWVSHGVEIFRVDNPHTKSFRFWEWVIAEVQRQHPRTVFLAEAFTRPALMRYLAKAGFSQSYTYFTWKHGAWDLRRYLEELTGPDLREVMRPNFFANTPDILHEFLQSGGRAAFELRLILAATLSASYGIYSGFELCEHEPARPGSEDYLDSEKYQLRPRDFSQAPLRELIARVNQIRAAHGALQRNDTLTFHETDNGALLWFGKRDTRPGDAASGRPVDHVFVVANMDVHATQQGHVEVPLHALGLSATEPFIAEDLLDGARYTWRGAWNFVRLDPSRRTAHLFTFRRP